MIPRSSRECGLAMRVSMVVKNKAEPQNLLTRHSECSEESQDVPRSRDAIRLTGLSVGGCISDNADLMTRFLDSSLRCAAFGMTITVRRAYQGDENGGSHSNRHSSKGSSPRNLARRKGASWIPASAGMTKRVTDWLSQPASAGGQEAVSVYSHGDNLGAG